MENQQSKPPRVHRGGAPKGNKNAVNGTRFRDMLLRQLLRKADGDRTRLEKVADALITEAENGEVPAIQIIADRLDGKVPQAISGEVTGGLTVEIVRFAAKVDAPDSASGE